MRELKPFKFAAGSARVISMVVLAVILVCAYVALDFYTSGQQNASMVEGRGGAIVDALSRYKRETGGLPDALEKLVPKYLPALPKCPNGQAYAYKPAGPNIRSAVRKCCSSPSPISTIPNRGRGAASKYANRRQGARPCAGTATTGMRSTVCAATCFGLECAFF